MKYMVMRREKQCPLCGTVGPMKFGYCENCRIISPGSRHGSAALTRRALLKRAAKVLGVVGAAYSPVKDGCVAMRNRIASRPTTTRHPGPAVAFKFDFEQVPEDTAVSRGLNNICTARLA